jgi:hypothetical protein
LLRATENTTFQQLAKNKWQKIIWNFQNVRNGFGKVPEINKAGINEDSVLPTALELEKSAQPKIKHS